MEFSEDQESAINEIITWYINDTPRGNFMTLGGVAGSGKTTLIKYILEEVNDINSAVIAYTGKACDVLRRKSVEANTIHSFLYNVVKTQKPNGTEEIAFTLKPRVSVQLVIVDEASMVPEAIFKDLMTIGGDFKILFIGDHGQLMPIGKSFNLMRNPMIKLENVHRTAMDNPLIRLSMRIRTGKGSITKEEFNGDEGFSYCKKLLKSERGKDEYERAVREEFENHMMITSTNSIRCAYNKRIRSDIFGDFTKKIYEGEKIIILENSRSANVFNGMMMKVNKYFESEKAYSVNQQYLISKHAFGVEKPKSTYDMQQKTGDHAYRMMISADYGYCITCHKAQGSQDEAIFVKFSKVDKNIWGDQFRRWLYTAVTRAEKRVYIFEELE